MRLSLGLGVLLLAAAALLLLPGAGAWWLYHDALNALPPLPTSGSAAGGDGPSHFFDRSGEALLFSVGEAAGGERPWLTLAELPAPLPAAALLAEDPDFLTRPATSPLSLALRLWQAAPGDSPPQDSLTARLARNLFAPPTLPSGALTPLRVTALTAELERRHSREALLEWHLNTRPYGNDAWGIAAAARLYLDKPAHALTLDEIALLAVIPPAAESNPLQDEADLRRRQDDLLLNLLEAGHVGAREATRAMARETPVRQRDAQTARIAPEFSALAPQSDARHPRVAGRGWRAIAGARRAAHPHHPGPVPARAGALPAAAATRPASRRGPAARPL